MPAYANTHSVLKRLDLGEMTRPHANNVDLCQQYEEISWPIRAASTTEKLRGYLIEISQPVSPLVEDDVPDNR